MASVGSEIASVTKDIDKLSVNNRNGVDSKNERTNDDTTNTSFQPHLSGFETRELYKMALNFYKEKEGKAVHLSYEDKLKLVAFTQQATHGKCTPENSPALGVLDVIGKDRRLAWQNLGDISKEEAQEGFIILLDKLCPLFRTVVEAQKRNIEEQKRKRKEEELRRIEEEKREKELAEERQREEEERLKREHQRRQIQEALNQQTYHQFKAYAEQQYPGNPEQQGVLIRQLQEQHYHRYMQQLHQNRMMIEDNDSEKKELDDNNEEKEKETEEITEIDEKAGVNEDDEDSDAEPDWPPIEAPKMWTRPGVEEFKDTIRRDAGDAVIKVGHGETVTVRVPTHEDGAFLFWEFATDGYDIGFGVYFEWSKPDTNQVSVHISESEDDDDEDDYGSGEDLESGEDRGLNGEINPPEKPSQPPISVIVPVYRRDSQEEVYAGSHQYPGQGVYLLKFDNSYSLWRSKTLYYRVYYTRPSLAENPS